MALLIALLVSAASGQDLFLSPRQPFPALDSRSGPLSSTVVVRGGVVMPTISLGSSGHCHPDPDGTERGTHVYNATLTALQNGYRGFHDALSYGNQACIGAAVRDVGIPRKQLFLMSMVPKYLMGYNETKASVEASLVQLQVEYLDLVMVHHRAAAASEWPRVVTQMKAFPDNWAAPGSPVNNGTHASWLPPACALQDSTWVTCQDETWRALTELRAAGKIRAIGVSNWMISNLQRMADLGQELPAVNQIEQHIGWWDSQMLDWCAKHGVVVQAASPLSRVHPAIVRGEDPVIRSIADKYNRTTSQVAMRFLIEKGVAAIPASSNPIHQKQSLDVFDFRFTDAEVRALGTVAFQCRTCDNCYKCWGDPATLMCTDTKTGSMFHCP